MAAILHSISVVAMQSGSEYNRWVCYQGVCKPFDLIPVQTFNVNHLLHAYLLHDKVIVGECLWYCFMRGIHESLVTNRFPSQRLSNAYLWCFLYFYPSKMLNLFTKGPFTAVLFNMTFGSIYFSWSNAVTTCTAACNNQMWLIRSRQARIIAKQ